MLKLSGFVIKKMDYSADDEIISILSNHEVISLIALGTRKLKSKNRVALQIGNFVEIEYFRARLTNKLSKVKRATLLQQPPLMIGDTAEVVLDIYSFLTQMQNPSKKVFEALIDVYSYFNEDNNHYIKTFVLFAFLDALGNLPEDNHCIECGRPDRINGFEFYKGGFTCVLHTKYPRALEELRAIKNLFLTFDDYKKTDQRINQKLNKEIKIFISEGGF